MANEEVGLHVEDFGGTGRPVVLIHGWPLSGKAWEKQVPALQDAGFRVIAYDRRGFGESNKPDRGFDYGTLAGDLASIINEKSLLDVSLVGFSMGGGEVAKYVADYGEGLLHSVVFAAAVPPYMLKGPDNPEGPLTKEKADEMENGVKTDRDGFFDQFTTDFFSANGKLMVTEEERQKAIALCNQSDQQAVLGCMKSFSATDFRADLKQVTVPALVIHGDADAIVPLDGSGQRTHQAIPHSKLVVIAEAPHGFNVSHAERFNTELIAFLRT